MDQEFISPDCAENVTIAWKIIMMHIKSNPGTAVAPVFIIPEWIRCQMNQHRLSWPVR